MTTARATAAPHAIDAFKARIAGRQLLAANDPKTFRDLEAHVNAKVQKILAAPLSDKELAEMFAGPQPFEVVTS